ncbi:carboxypeptidase regulatory-like domain-containing protein [Ahniella affigens]|nr:carboxypeptidase regulatory-like domain-containing protein [Ahniella affigens]
MFRFLNVLTLVLLFNTPVRAEEALIFRSSFEALPSAQIELSSRQPIPDSQTAPRPDLWVGANFSVPGPLTPGLVSLRIDASDVTESAEVTESGIRYLWPSPLALGTHQVQLRVGASTESWSFVVIDGPTLSDISPSGVLLPGQFPSHIRARFEDAGSDIATASARVLLDGVQLTDVQVTLDDPRSGTLSATLPDTLAVGEHAITIALANAAGARTEFAGAFSVDSPATYDVSTLSPLPGAISLQDSVIWQVQADSNHAVAESLRLANGDVWVPEDYAARPRVFRVPVRLAPGPNAPTATVVFDDGTTRDVSFSAVYDAAPVVFIDEPADFASFGPLVGPGGATNLTGTAARAVRVAGSLSRPVQTVTINQQLAELSADRTHFQFPTFFLHEGTNLLTVSAVDEFGRTGVAQRTLYVDQTAPILSVESPAEGAITASANVSIRGIANDAVEAQVGALEPSVRITNQSNGASVQATVSNRYFRATELPLALGLNRLDVSAEDQHGNVRHQTLTVTRIAGGTPQLAIVSGDTQRAPTDVVLAAPLVVAALTADGSPLTDANVQFDVVRGSGLIATDASVPEAQPGQLPSRHLSVQTDDQGLAQVWFRLGNEAGAFAQVIRARLDGAPEEQVFMAQAETGAAAWVLVHGASGTQYVQAGAEPVEALSALVIDGERNPIVDASVRFLIENGDAQFRSAPPHGTIGDDGRSLTVQTDKNGVASVRPTVGTDADTVRVRAQVQSNGGWFGAADFQLVVLPARDGPTAFSGVVLDHTGQPLPGVRVSIGRTAQVTTTNAAGKFRFEDQVPAGKIDLHVDGTGLQTVRSGQPLQYPGLHFEVPVIAGQENQLPHAIYLPPINVSAAATVGGDADVSLRIPGIEGFAMVVKAHSVTFPDGSHTGPLVVTPVHGDRLPMVPPGGFATFGAVAWTIQPTGTRFDPPIEVHLPNSAGLKPGETLPIVQWDHDLASFVPMGRGTVDEAGASIVSDAGSGITKAGWGGGPPPVPPNCGENPPPSCRGATCGGCPQCQVSEAQPGQQCPACRPDLAQAGKQCGSNWCHRCKSGRCGPDPVNFPTTAPAGVTEVTFTAPRVEVGFTTNKGEFHGHRNGSQPAEWDFKLDAYCNPDGLWRFKLKKAEIKSVIVRPSLPGWREYSTGDMLGFGPSAGQTQCQFYDSVERQLRYAASSHYYLGTAYHPNNNPDIVNLNAAGWNAVWVPNWDTWTEVYAHESLHYRRFKRYAAQSFAALENYISRLTQRVDRFPSKEEALNSDFVVQQFDQILNQFSRDIGDLQTNSGFGDHDPPDEFYACSMGALLPDLTALDVWRQSASCPLPSRPLGACPN